MAVVFGVGVGLGVAYWTGGGSGSGSANTGTAAGVTVIQTVSPTGLFPGGAAALSGNFNNPSSGNVFVTAVTASVTVFSARRRDEAGVYAGRLLDHGHRERERRGRGRERGGFVVGSVAQHERRRNEPGQLQEHHRADHVRGQLMI